MQAYASFDDLISGWPEAESRLDQDTAETLLVRATAQLSSMLTRRGIVVDPEDEVQALNLCGAVCSMVRSSAAPSVDGISSMSQTIGSTKASVQMSNPDGSFYLSRYWRDILGITTGGTAYIVMPAAYATGDGE